MRTLRCDRGVQGYHSARPFLPATRPGFETQPLVVRLTKRIRRRIRPEIAALNLDKKLAKRSLSEMHDNGLKHQAQHLVVMVNGLNGAPANWNHIKEELRNSLGEQGEEWKTVFYVSQANRRLETFTGICTCATRLSTELHAIIPNFPSLTEISFLVHSMGGLISRYACGLHFDPRLKTVFGLRPRHYVSIATPHLGCDTAGESQVPMLGWGKSIPWIGHWVVRPILSVATPFVMRHIYRRTGQQLYLMDGRIDRRDPRTSLLCRLVQDIPEEGYFLSALKQFQTRTCYANVRHDALVGWANASLRHTSELPESVSTPLDKGITYRMDPLRNSMWPHVKNDDPSEEPSDLTGEKKQELVEFMLSRLQSMPWCRIDVAFRNPVIPFLAHTHIQVTRKWIDFDGQPVVRHICDTIGTLECMLSNSTSTTNGAEASH